MDNFEHALEKTNEALRQDKQCLETALKYYQAKASDLNAEVERLTRERDNEARLKQVYQDAERLALMSVEAWKVRAEAAEADSAALVETLNLVENDLSEDEYKLARQRATNGLASNHPGAALLEERKRITKTLDAMDVPSEADEQEMGRACDLAGRVELLATWGQRGWREYRKTKDREAALLERLRAAEKVVEAARPALSVLRAYSHDNVVSGHVSAEATLEEAIAAYDAAREGK